MDGATQFSLPLYGNNTSLSKIDAASNPVGLAKHQVSHVNHGKGIDLPCFGSIDVDQDLFFLDHFIDFFLDKVAAIGFFLYCHLDMTTIDHCSMLFQCIMIGLSQKISNSSKSCAEFLLVFRQS